MSILSGLLGAPVGLVMSGPPLVLASVSGASVSRWRTLHAALQPRHPFMEGERGGVDLEASPCRSGVLLSCSLGYERV